MFYMIDKKAEELRSISPRNPEFKQWLDQSNLWYWLYFDMNLQGIKAGKRQIADVLAGQLLDDCPMEVYGYVHRFASIYRDMKSYLVMKSSLTPRMLDDWCAELFPRADENGDPLPVKRTSTSAIYEWGHIPPHFHEISALMTELLSTHSREHYAGSYIDRILEIYMELLRIYPYGERSVTMAGIALVYGLLEEGLPVPGPVLTETEYNTAVAEYMEHQNAEPLRSVLERSIYNRIDAVCQAAIAAEENDE